MAELRIWNKNPAGENGAADPCAERDHHHGPLLFPAGTMMHLRQAGGIRVVDHREGKAGRLLEKFLGVFTHPTGGEIGGRLHHALAHDSGKPGADRT